MEDVKLSKDLMDNLKSQLGDTYEAVANGESVEKIAKDLYKTLPDKSDNQAELIVEAMSDCIDEYHSEFNACMESRKDFIESELQDATKDMSQADRNAYLGRILTAISAKTILDEEGEEAAEAYLESHKNAVINEELEADLFDTVVNAMENFDISSDYLSVAIRLLQNENLESVKGAFALGESSKNIKLLLAMQYYVNYCNGCYEDAPDDLSIDYVVYSVCAAVDMCAVASMLENKEITEDKAEKILRTIGAVLGVAVLGFLAFCVGWLIKDILLLMLPDYPIVAIAVATMFVFSGLSADTILNAAEIGADSMEHLGYLACKGFYSVKAGFEKLAAWVTPKFLAAKEWLKKNVLQRCFFKDVSVVEVEAVQLSEEETFEDESCIFNDQAEECYEEEQNSEFAFA